MGFFNKKSETEEEQRAPRNPNNTVAFRLLAIGYIGYMCVNMVKLYTEGGPDAPSLTGLIAGVGLLGGGCIFLAIISYREWKRGKEAYDQYMAELRAEAEAKRAAVRDDAQVFLQILEAADEEAQEDEE